MERIWTGIATVLTGVVATAADVPLSSKIGALVAVLISMGAASRYVVVTQERVVAALKDALKELSASHDRTKTELEEEQKRCDRLQVRIDALEQKVGK